MLLELFDARAERAVVKNMIRLAKSAKAPNAVSAATWLWERKYGKVPEQIIQDVTVKGYAGVSPDEWEPPAAG